MTHLFLFTLGPVQGFIAQARKTRDLKAGSQILSELVHAGLQEAQQAHGARIILPYATARADSLPNRFLAEVDLPDDEALRAMGQAIEAAVKAKWHSIALDAKAKMAFNSGINGWQRFDEQLVDYWEIFWVFEPVDGSNDYRRAYQQIESNLGAIKNLRAFRQLPDTETHRKCSITGERDAILFSAKAERVPPFVVDKRSRKISDVQANLNASGIALSGSNKVTLREGEGLSAVAAVKRFYQRPSFMSTAEVATLNFVHKAENEGQATSVYFGFFKDFQDELRATDWQLFFPENQTDRALQREGSRISPDRLKEFRKVYGQLMGFANREEISRPKPYYALLTFDGDRMGATWSGDEAFLPSNVDLRGFQEALAEHLYRFADEAGQILSGQTKGYTAQRHQLQPGQSLGQAVYAGGDDFMGFVNLEYLSDVMHELRQLYRERVSQEMQKAFPELKRELTFSAGVCIAHYKTDLGEVVRKAQAAQEYAKEQGGRDAFALYLMKRSGEIQQATAKWGEDCYYLDQFAAVVELLLNECFSNTFITVLHEEVNTLVGRATLDDSTEQFEYGRKIIELEAKRLIRRSLSSEKPKAQKYLKSDASIVKQGPIEDMQAAVLALLQASSQEGSEPNTENFLHFLEIADFIHRQPDSHAS
jgi:CRISPR-associated protein Cmr2